MSMSTNTVVLGCLSLLLSIYTTSYAFNNIEGFNNVPKAWAVPQNVKFSSLDKLTLINDAGILNQENDKNTVKIATKAIGLNFADIFTVLGLYAAANEVRGKDISTFIPGLEFSGIVLDDPSGMFRIGDSVLGFTRFGAYSDIVHVPPFFLKPLPKHWSFAEGASFIVQALTAWHGLVEIGRMPVVDASNEKPFIVIVHSAAGGVGLWASEIAARRGGIVLGIVGSESKAGVFYNRIKEFSPFSQVMIRGNERDFEQRLTDKLQNIHRNFQQNLEFDSKYDDLKKMAKHGYGSDVVMESLGGQYFQACFKSLNDGGALVTFGSTSYVNPGLGINMLRLIYRYITRPRVDPGALTSRNIRLSGFNLIYLTERAADLRRELNECIACLSGLKMMDESDDVSLDLVTPPLVGETIDFTQAIKAMEMLKAGQTVGKVVLDNDKNPFSNNLEDSVIRST